MNSEDEEKNTNYEQEEPIEEYRTTYEDVGNQHQDAASNVKMSISKFFGTIFSHRKIIIIILVLAILAPIFVGLSYFSKLYGEGNITGAAVEYLLDEELGIKEANGQGYYFTLGKDIIEKYEKALNASYESGEYYRESLDDTENAINKRYIANYTESGEKEFSERTFEEWFNTEDRSVWEAYLVKMFRTEIASSYPRLGNYEGESGTTDLQGTKKDSNGDYVAQGKVEIKRTKINDNGTAGETVTLQYMPKDELDKLIKANDYTALNYYSFDEISGYLYYATYTKRQYIAGNNKYEVQNTLGRNWIQYKDVTSACSMPYNFLAALLQTTENPGYVMTVADLVFKNTKIELMIQDELKVTKDTEVLQNGTTAQDITYTNSASAYIKKAKTWNIDFEDTAVIRATIGESTEYTNSSGGKVNREITNYVAQISSVKEKKINYERFLGLWKNETGEYAPGELFKASGKEVGYMLPPDYTEKGYPARTIASSDDGEDIDILLDLLSRHDNTQMHEQIMMYFWNIYTGEKIYDIDANDLLALFNIDKFKTATGTGAYGYTIPERIWFALKEAGYSDNAASAVVAQVAIYDVKEFKNSTQKVLGISEEEYANNVGNGIYTNFVNDGIAFGIGKWITPERKKGLQDYSKSKGKNINDIEIQIQYLIAELDITGTSDASKYAEYQLGTLGDSWKNAKTPEEATDIYYRAYIKGIEQYIEGEETSETTGNISTNKIISINTEIKHMASNATITMTETKTDDSTSGNSGFGEYTSSKDNTIGFYSMTPENLNDDAFLIVYLHGVGSIGPSDYTGLENSPIPTAIRGEHVSGMDDNKTTKIGESYENGDFAVFMPNWVDGNFNKTISTEELDICIQEYAQSLGISSNRIVLEGHSFGVQRSKRLS